MDVLMSVKYRYMTEDDSLTCSLPFLQEQKERKYQEKENEHKTKKNQIKDRK